MATIIYSDQFGARTTKIFGCSFKSMTSQMGFNSQPIVFTLTVVEENDGDFTLRQNDIRSVQFISFGKLSILGILQSWEKTTVDPNGTGIYTIRITDARTVLETAKTANVFTDSPNGEQAFISSNLIYVGTLGGRLPTLKAPREDDEGITFKTLIERTEAATLRYGNTSFEVDMSALKPLKNFRGEGTGQYFIEGAIRGLVSTITEFCNAVGAEWWVESRRKTVVDPTIVIEIKIVRRLTEQGLRPSDTIETDALIALHADHIVRRKDGFENNDVSTGKVIWGGVKRELKSFQRVSIKQFWGFDNNNIPLTSPMYEVPSLPGRKLQTSISELEDVLNGKFDTGGGGQKDSDQLSALKKYMNNVWGRRFYVELPRWLMSDSSKNLPEVPEVVSAGWWENGSSRPIYPQGVQRFNANVEQKLMTDDGRWGPFARMDELIILGDGTVGNPIIATYATWTDKVKTSMHLLRTQGRGYMQCTVNQFGPYAIITLPFHLTRFKISNSTRQVVTRVTRHDKLDEVWIPVMDRSVHYGPWSNFNLPAGVSPSPGNVDVSIDADIVPWTFEERGVTHSQAMLQMTEMASRKIDMLPELTTISTGQLEVAGLPAVNIGQSIGLGGSITEIFIRFDTNGVTTRYVMNLFSRELGEFKRRKRNKIEKDDILSQSSNTDTFPKNKTDIDAPPAPEPEPTTTDDDGTDRLGDAGLDNVYAKPDGGMGTIDGKEGGPFYTVRRTNYADIDPNTFAGGLNVTGSYFLAEWVGVRNLAEPTNSPGLLQIGTSVTVSIFSQGDETGPYIPFIEVTPQVFSPPPLP